MRANMVKDYLIQKGKVSANRIQLKPAKMMAPTDKDRGQVQFSLPVQPDRFYLTVARCLSIQQVIFVLNIQICL